MGCSQSKSAASTAVSENHNNQKHVAPSPHRRNPSNNYNDLLPSQQNPVSNPSLTGRMSGLQRPPIATPQDIVTRGHGESHDALCAYSWNARNGYGVADVYDVGVFLGKGAFGQIFKVTHKFGGAEGFALKYFKPIELLQNMPLHSYDDITYKVGEIKSLLLMRGVPNILQIREFFFNFQDIQNAPLGLVTELMRGEDLDKWMKGRASMTQGVTELTASEITRSLLNAILAMHKRGIVHRDLKVSNLRITNPLDPGSIKVYDFGLAKVLDQQSPFAREDCGSLGYTAPELLLREPYGVEVDMFSAGVIIFFLLSGYRPFNAPGASRADVKNRIINCEYTLDQTRWNRVSKVAQNLVRNLLVQRDGDNPRLNAEQAIQHEWLREDEATRINLEGRDLNQNATYIETGAELEPVLSAHSMQSTIPGVQVDSAVKNVLSQIRNSQVGGGQYGEGVFTFVATETSVSAVPLVDYVTKTINNYTEERCRHLFFNIFKAFETLHQRNVVHRSIRREHIYVQENSAGNIRIIIGGMHNARVTVGGNPLTGNCGTSLVATAPEVYRAIAYDSSVDVWALGVLLYEFMTGLFPFRGKGRGLREEIARASVVFDDFFPGSNESRQLILALIRGNPRDRLSLAEAVQHPWFRATSLDNDLWLAKDQLSCYG